MLREERQGATAVLTLDYPERRNALAIPMREALVAALERLEGDSEVRAIVLTGAGGTFCAGGDISGMNSRTFRTGRERFRTTHRIVRLLIEGSKPVIAAVEGWAVGAGFGMALCCDTIVAAETAKFMTGFGKIGLIADFGLLHTLPRRVGEGRARQILLYGEQVEAAAAERMGLVDHLVPTGDALQAALAKAEKFQNAAPIPLAMTKAFLAKGLAESLDWERNTQSTMFLTADHVEGREAFMAKRVPAFKGA